ncbi:MAG: 30S ribosomal protein S6 [Polyangiales bacterium]
MTGTVFIVRPDIDADASEKIISRAVSAIEQTGGKLTRVESWGRRRLAYPIAKQRKGFYVYVRYLGQIGTVAELERNLRMMDTVIRHMSVQLAKDIDFAAVTVDPEEIKVRRIEVSSEDDDQEESFEASLGLSDDDRRHAPPPPPAPSQAPAAEAPAAEAPTPAGDA